MFNRNSSVVFQMWKKILVCLEKVWAIKKSFLINCSPSIALNFKRIVSHYTQRPGFMQVGISIPSAQPTVNPFFIWLLIVWINVDSKMSAYRCPTKNYCPTSSVPPHLHKALVIRCGIFLSSSQFNKKIVSLNLFSERLNVIK